MAGAEKKKKVFVLGMAQRVGPIDKDDCKCAQQEEIKYATPFVIDAFGFYRSKL